MSSLQAGVDGSALSRADRPALSVPDLLYKFCKTTLKKGKPDLKKEVVT